MLLQAAGSCHPKNLTHCMLRGLATHPSKLPSFPLATSPNWIASSPPAEPTTPSPTDVQQG